MAETITIICPECEKSIKAPEDVIGKRIRCKGCGETFTARAPKDSPKGIKPAKDKPAKDKPDKKKPDKDKPEGEEETGAYGLREEYLGARCPECAEKMGDDDVICLSCGYSTITRTKPKPRKIRETTGGDVFLHLLPGIICATFGVMVLTWLIADFIYWAFFWELELEGVENARAARSCAYCCITWWSIFRIWVIYKLGRFAVKRLILDNKPAEIEERWGEDGDDD
jgi:hypothetical protein